MKLRCPSCNVILRVKATSVGDRETACCPRCSADVSLANDRFDAVVSENRARVKVRCQSCGTHLKALESFVGTRSNCPKCHDEVLIERSSSAAVGAEVSAVGSDTMAMQKPPLPESDVDLDEFLDEPRAMSAGTDMSPVGGATGGLLNAPIDALTEAAQGIRESAENFGHNAPLNDHEDDRFDADDASDDSFEHVAQHDEDHDDAHVEQHHEREFEASDEEFGETVVTQGKAGFTAGSGFLSGALSGMVVGGVWFLASTFGGASLETFMSPLPSWTGGWGIPTAALVIAFPALFGALVGLIATLSSTSKDTGPNFVRCVAWGLLGGLFMASMTITQPGDVFNQVAFSSALNWIRDFMLVGMLIPAVARLFGPTNA